MTSLFRREALALAVLLIMGANADAADGPRAGLWKVSTRVVRDGATIDQGSQSNCVSADQVKDPSKALMPPDTDQEKCTRTQYEWTGSKLSWRMQCNGQMAMNGGGDLTFDTPEHYRGNITTTGTLNGHGFTSTIFLEGERVGECPSASP